MPQSDYWVSMLAMPLQALETTANRPPGVSLDRGSTRWMEESSAGARLRRPGSAFSFIDEVARCEARGERASGD